ncbi:MAG: hypothetical protein NT075_26125, partial [Chloroflexi bacterium]|nr:hypothetical protein [Chloroflexota bacterium]
MLNTRSYLQPNLPPEQAALRDKCVHPTGNWTPFAPEEIQQSIPQRFERIAARFADHLALKSPGYELTYQKLNRLANQIAHL